MKEHIARLEPKPAMECGQETGAAAFQNGSGAVRPRKDAGLNRGRAFPDPMMPCHEAGKGRGPDPEAIVPRTIGWLFLSWGLFLLGGCSGNMTNASRLKPLEESSFFADGSSARPLPAFTVARGHLNEDDAFYRGRNGTNLVTTFPLPINLEVLQRGRERYDIYCAVCHGGTGEGNGMIVQRGFPPPPSFHIDRLRQAPVGHFFDVITHGYGIMYSYASRVEARDRWAITAYIRALQLSQNARLEDVPLPERNKLEVPQ